MPRTLGHLFSALAALFLLSASAHAQDAAWFNDNISTVIKQLAHNHFAVEFCKKLDARKSTPCTAHYQKMSEVAKEKLQRLYEWKKVFSEKNKTKAWEERIRYEQLAVAWEEIVEQDWDKNFFGAQWDTRTNGKAPILEIVGLQGSLTSYARMKDNFCKDLPMGPAQVECDIRFGMLLEEGYKLLELHKKVNNIYQANGTKQEYFKAVLERQRAVVNVVSLEAIVHQHYMP